MSSFAPRAFSALAAGLLLLAPVAARPDAAPDPAHAHGRRPWLSAAGQALFQDLHRLGQYAHHPLARWYAAPPTVEGELHEGGLASIPAVESATDALVNDRLPLTCSGCQNLGIAQDEATVAMEGMNILVGWNDLETRCITGSRQNYGWSMDGGATFVDGNKFPPSSGNGRLYGDPTHAVNERTHDFYVAGLAAGAPPQPSFLGLGGVRGHFEPSGFVLDLNKLCVVNPNPSQDFFDKPWMTVDSLSGNVYFAWANFTSTTSFCEFQAFDSNLDPLGPIIRLNPDEACGMQFAVPVVGPDGVLYVTWRATDCATGLASVAIRRSTDFGATFEPVHYIAWHSLNIFSGGPGFLRSFASCQPSIIADETTGPHRGRLYAAWDECVDYLSSRSATTSVVDAEPNGTSAQAQLFVPGGKLRGTKSGIESDWYRFQIQAGQTFYLESVIDFGVPGGYDSTRTDVGSTLYCSDAGGALTVAHTGALTSSGKLYTARHDGTMYLQIRGVASDVSPYVAWTNLVSPPPGARARDHRDQVMTWSDDGLNWSTPIRIVDSAPGFDAQYPWLAVDGRGRVHCSWMDFRIDDRCDLPRSIQVITSSGDGGVTWGPNRTITDAPSFWNPAVCVSNGNNQGDYQHTVADGDRVVAAFTDQRFGDPDVMVDASVYRAVASCIAAGTVTAGQDTTVTFTLANEGNFSRALGWRLEDTRGWLAGGTPGLAGVVTLAAGQTTPVEAIVHASGCNGDATELSFVHFDPAIPGFEERCTTILRCSDGPTPALPMALENEVAAGRVRVTWFAADAAELAATVSRRSEGGSWRALGRALADGRDRLVFEDRETLAEGRYGYRLELATPAGPVVAGETWVDVLPPRFALAGAHPNPATGRLAVSITLESGDAVLELFDVTGRRVATRELGALGPGAHTVWLGGTSRIAPGVYTLRLAQGPRAAFARAVVLP